MWDEQKQARFDRLREQEDEGALTQEEVTELETLIAEIDAHEAEVLQKSAEREEVEGLRLETQNAALASLLRRRETLARRLEQWLAEARAEEASIEEELAQIRVSSDVSPVGTLG